MKNKTDYFTTLVKSDLKLDCVKEHYFCKGRMWRFDYAIPSHKIAIEVEGGVFKERTYRNKKGVLITTIGGRHNSGEGFLKDMEKYNKAAVLGWKVIRVVPTSLNSNDTLNIIKEAVFLNRNSI